MEGTKGQSESTCRLGAIPCKFTVMAQDNLSNAQVEKAFGAIQYLSSLQIPSASGSSSGSSSTAQSSSATARSADSIDGKGT